jgi:hypothetical protein
MNVFSIAFYYAIVYRRIYKLVSYYYLVVVTALETIMCVGLKGDKQSCRALAT